MSNRYSVSDLQGEKFWRWVAQPVNITLLDFILRVP